MFGIDLKSERALAALGRLRSGTADMTPVMHDLGDFLVASTQDRFDKGIAPDGSPWAPKTAATLAAYARSGEPFDTRPLRKTGTMARTIFYQASPNSTLVGSNAIQAAVMQGGAAEGAFGAMANGAPIPWGRIPARPFIGLSETDEDGIVTIVEDWLGGLVED